MLVEVALLGDELCERLPVARLLVAPKRNLKQELVRCLHATCAVRSDGERHSDPSSESCVVWRYRRGRRLVLPLRARGMAPCALKGIRELFVAVRRDR